MSWLMRELRAVRLAELRYARLILLLGALLLAYMMITPPYLERFAGWMGGMGSYGYLGAFIAGAVASFGITVPPAAAALFVLGSQFPPWAVAAAAATGGTVADLLMYELAKRRLAKVFVATERKHPKLSKWTHRLAPLIVGFIIASPLPDELAAGIVGAMRFDEKEFIVIVWAAHFVALGAVAGAGAILV